MDYYELRYKRTGPKHSDELRKRLEPRPVESCPETANEAYAWYADEVLRLDTANRELWALYELRGGALVRVDTILNTFASAELAVKAIRELFRQLKDSERLVQ